MLENSDISSEERISDTEHEFKESLIDTLNQEISELNEKNSTEARMEDFCEEDLLDYDTVKANENGVEFGEQWIRKVARGRQLKHKKGNNYPEFKRGHGHVDIARGKGKGNWDR